MVTRLVGERVHRVEDQRLLIGRGRFVDDVVLPRMLHAAFLRSPVPHARLVRVDTMAARALEGVVAVYTAADVEQHVRPILPQNLGDAWLAPPYLPLAHDKVRFVGDPFAIVVARTRALAEDAVNLIEVDYEDLAPVTGFAHAMADDAAKLYDEMDDNVVFRVPLTNFGDPDRAFAEADRVIDVTLTQSRQSNTPLETRGIVADFDPGTGELTCYASTQSPQRLRRDLSHLLGQPHERLRVHAVDCGGAFGLKAVTHREDSVVALASKLTGRPVKWIEDRNEHLLVAGHARDESIEIAAAVKSDGTLLGFRARLSMDVGAYGAYPNSLASMARFIGGMLQGPYLLTGYSYEATVVATNKTHTVAYRGPWEMETWARERLYDVIARELGLDPAEVRRKTLSRGAPTDAMHAGGSLAGVSATESLDDVLRLIGYDDFAAEQAAAREQGRYLGLGFATFIEGAPGPANRRVANEQAVAKLELDGHLTIHTPQAPHGQGHETTLAQIAADELGIPFEHVRISHGDTSLTPFSPLGTGGSRSATWASGSVMFATRAVKEKVLSVAASLLEIDPADLEIADGRVVPRGAPDKAVPLETIARQAITAPATLPPGVDRLEATALYRGEGIGGSGWSGGTHACVVEVDPRNGRVSIVRYVVVEDCGPVINPGIVEGQIRGGVAQGIAGVLYERVEYDDDGQNRTATFMDYLLPTSAEVPEIEIVHLETPDPGEVGFRGVGEGGAIVAPATLTNAIEDALEPLGVRIVEQHLPPSRMLELIGVIAADVKREHH